MTDSPPPQEPHAAAFENRKEGTEGSSPQKRPIFICYRRDDRSETATRLFELLNRYRFANPNDGTRIEIDPYLDEKVPGVADWEDVHQPYLKKAVAFIVVCTPGAWADLRSKGKEDWVHREIDWWLANRPRAPILVDPLGAEDRWIPDKIAAKWPRIQRLSLIEHVWRELNGSQLIASKEETRDKIVRSLLPSQVAVYRQQLEADTQKTAQRRSGSPGRPWRAYAGLLAEATASPFGALPLRRLRRLVHRAGPGSARVQFAQGKGYLH